MWHKESQLGFMYGSCPYDPGMWPQQDTFTLNLCMDHVRLSGAVGSPGVGEVLLQDWALGRAGAVWGAGLDEAAKEEEKQVCL